MAKFVVSFVNYVFMKTSLLLTVVNFFKDIHSQNYFRETRLVSNTQTNYDRKHKQKNYWEVMLHLRLKLTKLLPR